MAVRIQQILTLLLILVSIVPIAVLGSTTYIIAEKALTNEIFLELEALAAIQEERVQEIIVRESTFELEQIIAVASRFTGNTLTGEMLIAKKNNNGDAQFLHPRRFESAATTLPGKIVPKERLDIPITQALLGNEGVFKEVVDYRGEPVFAATRYVEGKDFGIVVKIDQAEALAPIRKIRTLTFLIAFIATLFAAVVGLLISRTISSPIARLTESVDAISRGNLKIQLEPSNVKEIQSLIHSLSRVLASMKLAILRVGITKREMGLKSQSSRSTNARSKQKRGRARTASKPNTGNSNMGQMEQIKQTKSREDLERLGEEIMRNMVAAAKMSKKK